HGDFLIAAAPMPYLMCSTEQDFFPLAGARKTFAEARRIYGVLGAEDRVAWAVGPGGHGMPLNVREAIYGWMSRWLKGAATTQASEPRLRTEFEEDLYCTPSGQVSLSLGGDTASSLNIKRYAALPPPRPSPATSGDLERLRTELRSRVVELTRYQPSTGSLSIDEGEPVRSPGYTTRPIHFEPSPGRRLPARLILPEPESQPRKTLLYIGRPGADLDQLAQAGYTILAFEPSGAGETSSKWGGYAEQWFGQDKVTWLALMVGRPLVGIRIDDIRRAVDLLEQRGLLADGCTAFAKGSSAIDLLFAAVLDDRIRGVNLEGGLLSYASIVRTPIHRRIFESVVPGVLKSLDLPQLVAALAPRPVVLRNLTSPLGTIEPLPRAQAEYRFARDTYQAAGAAGNLEIGLRREDEPVLEAYPPIRLSAASRASRPAR
ncbi:MAG TPA: hypothetical protein VG672_27290, partial [Bryobacteraceae bacterium]|nr:hypothetical protein [Bryobacteraceae bacterium]